ncbi:MAG: TIR domain-containing protein [Clostridiales bacterium]|nr:TIR domain-containing protein [Clostridiales bacterium]
MIDFYNAFISYKHDPLDSKVAESIQRSLEHYYIPTKIRKKTGRKKIERIFRDKDELPITSNLTETISNALEKAEYLIVICSPNTKKSVWVQREIEYFLKNHTKDKILTVLAGGEPYEVIPKILLTQEREITEEDGNKHVVTMDIEPLSCDYRLPLRKAKKEELPRLAATLIGCSYDELVRRERQYKTRRNLLIGGVVFSLALLFCVYIITMSRQVYDAYVDSLASRSRYLAKESEALLEDQQRIDALYLALAALPQDEDDQTPVTGEAVAALSEATLAYQGESGFTVDCVWNYSASNNLKDFKLNSEGTRLVSNDESGAVCCWNTESHEKLFEITLSEYGVRDYVITDDGVLVIICDMNVLGYDVDTGDQLFVYESEYALLSDGVMIPGPGTILVGTFEPAFLLINTSNGNVERTYDLPSVVSGVSMYYSDCVLSPDGTKVGFSNFVNFGEFYMGVYDLETGTVTLSTMIDKYVNNVAWIDDERIVSSSLDMSDDYSSTFNGMDILRNNVRTIRCYSPDDMSIIWESEFVGYGIVYEEGFFLLPASDQITYYSGSTCCAYDIDTGEMINDWNVGNIIVDVSDRDGNGVPLIMTDNGDMVTPSIDIGSDVVGVYHFFPDDIVFLDVNHGVYLFRKYSNDILYFDSYIHDEEWEQTEDLVTESIADDYLDDDLLVLLTDSDDGTRLIGVDPEENEVAFDVIAGGTDEFVSDFRILGTTEDDIYILHSISIDGMELLKVDKSDGDITRSQIADSMLSEDLCSTMLGGYIAYVDEINTDSVSFGLYDIEEDSVERFEIETGDPYSIYDVHIAPVYYDELGVMYVSLWSDDYIIDVDSGDITKVDLPSDWSGTTRIFQEDRYSYIIVSDGRHIIFIDQDGEVDRTFSSGGRTVLGFTVLNDESLGEEYEEGILVVAYANGSLSRYDLATDSLIGDIQISRYLNSVPVATFDADFDAGYLYVKQGRLLSVIDMNSWVEYSYIDNCFGHHGPTDRFFTLSYEDEDETGIGFYRHYTLDELIERARQMLGGMPVPDDLRDRYGL